MVAPFHVVAGAQVVSCSMHGEYKFSTQYSALSYQLSISSHHHSFSTQCLSIAITISEERPSTLQSGTYVPVATPNREPSGGHYLVYWDPHRSPIR